MTIRLLQYLIFAATLLAISSCQKGDTEGKPSDVDYYTCTMHPSVHSKDPGKCPICSMDLVPVKKEGTGMPQTSGPSAQAQTREFIVPVDRQQQIGVTYSTVARKELHRSVRAVGMIQPDVSRAWVFVARADGYVQKLNVTSPGEIVEKDAPILSVYSPDLLTSERELVELLRMRDEASSEAPRATASRLVDSATARLRQWNMTDEQIGSLEKSRAPAENLTLLSPFRGVVQSVPVAQGKNVKVGDTLAEIADLSVIWLWAEFYEDEISLLKQGAKVTVTTKAYPGAQFDGQIAVVDPFIDETRRTSKVRVDIPNPDFRLRPGMYVTANLEVEAGEGLTIPVNAVMPTGERSVVFVDKGEGKLEPRFVRLGEEYDDVYEVKEGVSEGERVVASANFLIDAEAKVQGALRDFEGPEGKQ